MKINYKQMKYPFVILLILLTALCAFGQISQISIGIGRADQWGKSAYTYVGDTAIGYESQRSMDSRTMYMVSMDHTIGEFHTYQVLAFSVMFYEFHILAPSKIIQYQRRIKIIKAPTFDYSINVSLLKPAKWISLYGGLNFRGQWAVAKSNQGLDIAFNSYNGLSNFTMGINLNLRYQTRWLRIEFGYIGDVTSTSKDFIHNGQIVDIAPLKMNKIYLVFSGPVFRREKPPKKLKKKDFIKN